MVVSKSSRKGKNAWRRNISTSKVEEAIAQKSRDERKGLELSGEKDEDLFFVDKEAAPVVSKKARRREPRLLKCQAILQGAHQARPVEGINKRNKKGGPGMKGHMMGKVSVGSAIQPKAPRGEVTATEGETGAEDLEVAEDVWGIQPEDQNIWGSRPKVTGKKKATLRGLPSKKATEHALPELAAVEVDGPGCSYNPDYEHHQESVAEAVAVEVYKNLGKELQPKAPPKFVDADDMDQLDELQRLQVEEEVDEEEEVGEDGGEDSDQGAGAKTVLKKTKSKRNRELAVRQAEKELQQRRQLKKQRHELSNLKQLNVDIEAEEKHRDLIRQRREANDVERSTTRAPKLGRVRYKEIGMRVLTSDEVEGSLRRLKSNPMLVLDRFKSLQKRGAIETTKKTWNVKTTRMKTYDRTSGEKAVAAQEEINEMTRTRKKLAKKLKASKK